MQDGLKVKDLERGFIYMCRLSNRKVMYLDIDPENYMMGIGAAYNSVTGKIENVKIGDFLLKYLKIE